MKRSLRTTLAIVTTILLFQTVTHADSTIEKVKYGGRDAYRLSDGRSEAVVVPELGRVMRYGFVGGANWLWNSPEPVAAMLGWKNWGGDKTWPAPQDSWRALGGQGWPPDAMWDGAPHRAEILPGKSLRTTSEVSPFNGARVVRTYKYEEGEFIIAQRVEKVQGDPVMISIWNITQIVPPDAVFLPIKVDSVYRDNFLWMSLERPIEAAEVVEPELLKMLPSQRSSYKVGSDSDFTSIAAVKDGVAFVERARRSIAAYPDSQDVSVELFNNPDPKAQYMEIELLSPLRFFEKGGAWTHTMRWNLHPLASKDVDSPETRQTVQALLQDKTGFPAEK